MGLVRGASQMSLGTWKTRSSKYQKFINLSNVFLTIASTILIFLAIVLMKFYHLDKLGFWDDYFVLTPHIMIYLGIFTFVICIYGFLISNHENRVLLSIMAILVSIAFFTQLLCFSNGVSVMLVC